MTSSLASRTITIDGSVGGNSLMKSDTFRHSFSYVPVGLKNVGNSCYANAALQCILGTVLSDALLDPHRASIFQKFASNTFVLRQGSGSFDTLDSNMSKLAMDSETYSEKMIRRETRQKRREDRNESRHSDLSEDNCRWLSVAATDLSNEYFLKIQQNQESNSDNTVFDLTNFLSFGHSSEPNVVDPGAITRHVHRLNPCLKPYRQEDAHEFLRAFLSTLTQDGRNKQLSSLCDGLLESALTCQTCRRTSIKRDRYMDLSLDIQSNHILDLHSALKSFTEVELLTATNKVECARCKVKRSAKKVMRLATAPTVLVCHLKRFSCDIHGRIVRLKKHISFPEFLEIDEYMSHKNIGRPPTYELVAILVHVGYNAERGHYVAFVKGGTEWYKVDDSHVMRVPKETVFLQQAYVLFYEVRGLRAQHGYVHHNHRELFPSPSNAGSSSPLDVFLNFCCRTDFDTIRDGICFTTRTKKTASSSESERKEDARESNQTETGRSTRATSCDSTYLSIRTDSSNSEPTHSSEKDILRRVHSSGELVITIKNGRR